MSPFFGGHISCSLLMLLTFAIVHICVSIQNINAHEMLGDSHKYFTFVSHICSLYLWSLKYSLFGSHILQISMMFALQCVNILHLAAIFTYSHP